jgi:hypothetical protein
MISPEQYRAVVGGFHRGPRSPPPHLGSSYGTLPLALSRVRLLGEPLQRPLVERLHTCLASLAGPLKRLAQRLAPSLALLLISAFLLHTLAMPVPPLEPTSTCLTSTHHFTCTSPGGPDPAGRPGGRHLAALALLLIIAGIEIHPGPPVSNQCHGVSHLF